MHARASRGGRGGVLPFHVRNQHQGQHYSPHGAPQRGAQRSFSPRGRQFWGPKQNNQNTKAQHYVARDPLCRVFVDNLPLTWSPVNLKNYLQTQKIEVKDIHFFSDRSGRYLGKGLVVTNQSADALCIINLLNGSAHEGHTLRAEYTRNKEDKKSTDGTTWSHHKGDSSQISLDAQLEDYFNQSDAEDEMSASEKIRQPSNLTPTTQHPIDTTSIPQNVHSDLKGETTTLPSPP